MNMRLAASWLAWLVLVSWAYLPGLAGPQLLDDNENLKSLQRIEQDAGFSLDVVLDNSSGPLGRPVAMATFVLEKLAGRDQPRQQKTTGLVLHLVNAHLVLALALLVFRAARVREPLLWAMLCAGFWLSMPLLLSTTLYTVQRMTLLAAGFAFASLCAYCLARDRQLRGGTAWPWFLGSGLALVMATLSKENGVLALPLMLLLECCIYRFRCPKAGQQRFIRLFHGLALVLPLLGLVALFTLIPERITGGYAQRDFSLVERLLSQAVIGWQYLGQVLWPQVEGMGVYHDDYPVSRSLMDPGVLPAVLSWLLIIVALILGAWFNRARWLVFAFGFFLIGHAMESGFIALELYFEHRNYLPAAGLLIGLVGLCAHLARELPELRAWLLALLVLGAGRNLWLLSSQAVVWSDTYLLHIAAIDAHPDSDRARLELAQLLARDGELELALDLADGSRMMTQAGGFHRAILYSAFYCRAGQNPPADLWQVKPPTDAVLAASFPSRQLAILVRLLIDGHCGAMDARQVADGVWQSLVDANGSVRGSPLQLSAMILLDNHLENYARSLRYTRRLLERRPEDVMGLQFQLYLASRLQLPDERQQALQRLQALRDQGRLNRQETFNLELFEQPTVQSNE